MSNTTRDVTGDAFDASAVVATAIDAGDMSPAIAAYLAADRSGRAAVRAACDAAMRAAITATDLPTAIAADALRTACADAAGTASRTASDAPSPADVYARRTAIGDAIATAIRADAYAAYLAAVGDDATDPTDGTDVSDDDMTRVVHVASSRVMARTDGTRRDVAAFIAAAFASVAPGARMTVADIARTASDAPSPGAIAARLFGRNGTTLPGVTTYAADASRARSASWDGTTPIA